MRQKYIMSEDLQAALELRNYPVKHQELFSILAVYHTNCIYNHVYTSAEQLLMAESKKSEPLVTTLHKAYEMLLISFSTEQYSNAADPQRFVKHLGRMHECYNKFAALQLTFDRFYALLVEVFLMGKAAEGKAAVNAIIQDILVTACKNFCAEVLRSKIPFIIQDHYDEEKPRVLQRLYVHHLLTYMFSVRTIKAGSIMKEKTSVSRDLYLKMEAALKGALKRHDELQETIAKQQRRVQDLKAALQQCLDRNAALEEELSKERSRPPPEPVLRPRPSPPPPSPIHLTRSSPPLPVEVSPMVNSISRQTPFAVAEQRTPSFNRVEQQTPVIEDMSTEEAASDSESAAFKEPPVQEEETQAVNSFLEDIDSLEQHDDFKYDDL